MDVAAPIASPVLPSSRSTQARHDDAIRYKERLRIGRELHDSTSQLLVALQLNLACLKHSSGTADSQGLFLALDQILQELHSEVRAISSSDEASSLKEDLPAALRTMATHFALLTRIKFSLDLQGDYVSRADGVEMSLYRIAQEALANVARHAEATEVRMRLDSRKSGVLKLTIDDDGVGFGTCREPDLSADGTGIGNIRQRVRDMGGRLTMRRLRHGSRLGVTLYSDVMPAASTV